MSLISVRNFVAPFTNTTHIVTIILFTVLFALFRMQGGRISVENAGSGRFRSEPPAAENARGSSASSRFGADANPADLLPSPNRRGGPAKAAAPAAIPDQGTITLNPEEGDLITQMIGKQQQNAESQPKEAPAQKPRPKTGGSFEDIERSLGIR